MELNLGGMSHSTRQENFGTRGKDRGGFLHLAADMRSDSFMCSQLPLKKKKKKKIQMIYKLFDIFPSSSTSKQLFVGK